MAAGETHENWDWTENCCGTRMGKTAAGMGMLTLTIGLVVTYWSCAKH